MQTDTAEVSEKWTIHQIKDTQPGLGVLVYVQWDIYSSLVIFSFLL